MDVFAQPEGPLTQMSLTRRFTIRNRSDVPSIQSSLFIRVQPLYQMNRKATQERYEKGIDLVVCARGAT